MTRSPVGKVSTMRVCYKRVRRRSETRTAQRTYLGHLLGDQGRHGRFERSSSHLQNQNLAKRRRRGAHRYKEWRTHSHDDDGDDEAAERSHRVDDDRRNCRNDEEDVTENGDPEGVAERLVSSQVGVGDVGTKERTDVDPEGVEGTESETSRLTQSERSRSYSGRSSSSGDRADGQGLLDEVGLRTKGSQLPQSSMFSPFNVRRLR